MILPNKILHFKESIIAKMPYVLNSLEGNELDLITIYDINKKFFVDINEYILVLDTLFVLGKINITKDLKVSANA